MTGWLVIGRGLVSMRGIFTLEGSGLLSVRGTFALGGNGLLEGFCGGGLLGGPPLFLRVAGAEGRTTKGSSPSV